MAPQSDPTIEELSTRVLFLLGYTILERRVPARIYQTFTNHLPMIYQRFTKNKAIFGILPSKNLPRIYQRFTKDLPKIYQVYQTLTKSYKIFFQFTKDLPTIYQKCLDKNILILLYVFSKKYLATVN